MIIEALSPLLLFASGSFEVLECPDAKSLAESMKNTGEFEGWNTSRLLIPWPFEFQSLGFMASKHELVRPCPTLESCAPSSSLMADFQDRDTNKAWIYWNGKDSLWVSCSYDNGKRDGFIFKEVKHVISCSKIGNEPRAECQIEKDDN